MEFNLSKFEMLHFGRLDVRGKYTIMARLLTTLMYRGGLGVPVYSSLKVATQIYL